TVPEPTPLPDPKDGAPTEHTIIPPPPKAPPVERAPETLAALEREKAREPITVPDEITEFHPLVERARKLLRRRKQEDYTVWREQPCLDMRVGPELFDRASRIFHIVMFGWGSAEFRLLCA